MDNNNNSKKTSSAKNNGFVGAAAIIVVGIFVICVIVVLAKGLFASNSADVPDGLYTGTIGSQAEVSSSMDSIVESVAESTADSALDSTDSTASEDSAVSSDSMTDSSVDSTADSASDSSDESSDETSSAGEYDGIGTAYVTDYVQLMSEPSADSEKIVCLSPNLEVTILEESQNGYTKVTFLNFGTDRTTGYVPDSYLVYNNN